MSRSRKYTAGFTLVELLVVIAIMALLLTMLAPSLQKAKFQAKMVMCMTNVKSLTSGLNNYASPVYVSSMPLAPGDIDRDGDVDQEDFGLFQACLSGDTRPYEAGCEDADLDKDGDVDQGDFTEFYTCMGGANQPPGC